MILTNITHVVIVIVSLVIALLLSVAFAFIKKGLHKLLNKSKTSK